MNRESIPPEALLAAYPEPMRRIAERLRAIVLSAEPEAIEAVRPGWRLIGYDLPIRARSAYFAYIAPENRHVHLGFHNGIFMDDPDQVLLGAGIVRQARWVTLTPSDAISTELLEGLVREAARVARMPKPARVSRLLDPEQRRLGSE